MTTTPQRRGWGRRSARTGRSRLLVLLVAVVAVALLTGCGDSDGPQLTTAADGTVSATLKTKSGDPWTVTLAEGVDEVHDVYGNYGEDPIGIWTADAGPITAKAGSLFAVAFEQSPSTGYRWEPTGDLPDDGVTTLLENGVNTEDPGTPGSSGTHYFVYRAVAVGTTTLEYGLIAPGADAPETTAKVDVVVE